MSTVNLYHKDAANPGDVLPSAWWNDQHKITGDFEIPSPYKLISNTISTDTIIEKTLDEGVTIDGVLLKDNFIALANVPTMDDAHIPDVETLSYTNPFATAQIPNLDASKITSGTFDLARIPTMDDARIPNIETLSYGGAFANAQIPDLDASKITTGILAVARGGLGKALTPTWTDDYIMVYKATPDEWQMEAKGAAGDPAAIADAVWNETASEHTTEGSFGKFLNDIHPWFGVGFITNME